MTTVKIKALQALSLGTEIVPAGWVGEIKRTQQEIDTAVSMGLYEIVNDAAEQKPAQPGKARKES